MLPQINVDFEVEPKDGLFEAQRNDDTSGCPDISSATIRRLYVTALVLAAKYHADSPAGSLWYFRCAGVIPNLSPSLSEGQFKR